MATLSQKAGVFAASVAVLAASSATSALPHEARTIAATPTRPSVTQPFSSSTRAPQGDIKAELQRMSPAVQKDGYTYIKMDRVGQGGDPAMDVSTMITFQS